MKELTFNEILKTVLSCTLFFIIGVFLVKMIELIGKENQIRTIQNEVNSLNQEYTELISNVLEE